MSVLTCPVCSGAMKEVERTGIHIDICTQCRGVWLDRGELEKILDAMKAEQNRGGYDPRDRNTAPPYAEQFSQRDHDDDDHDDDDDDDRRGGSSNRDYQGRSSPHNRERRPPYDRERDDNENAGFGLGGGRRNDGGGGNSLLDNLFDLFGDRNG